MEKFVKCDGCSNSKIQVFHSFDGSRPQTAYRLIDASGKPGMLIVGEPPADLAPDPFAEMPTDLLGLLALALLGGGGRRPDAATMASAMAERAGDTAPPVKLDADGRPRGPAPGDTWNAGRARAAAGQPPLPEADKPAEDPKVPAKPLKSLGLHICEDGGVVVTEWPEGAHPLTAVFASKSAGHAVGYALQSLQKARQNQRESARYVRENAEREKHPVVIVGVDLARVPDEAGFGIRS